VRKCRGDKGFGGILRILKVEIALKWGFKG